MSWMDVRLFGSVFQSLSLVEQCHSPLFKCVLTASFPPHFIHLILFFSLMTHSPGEEERSKHRAHASGLAEKHSAPHSAKLCLLRVQVALTKVDPTAHFTKTSVRVSLSWAAIPTREVSLICYAKIIFIDLTKQETSLGWNSNCSILESFPLGK